MCIIAQLSDSMLLYLICLGVDSYWELLHMFDWGWDCDRDSGDVSDPAQKIQGWN